MEDKRKFQACWLDSSAPSWEKELSLSFSFYLWKKKLREKNFHGIALFLQNRLLVLSITYVSKKSPHHSITFSGRPCCRCIKDRAGLRQHTVCPSVTNPFLLCTLRGRARSCSCLFHWKNSSLPRGAFALKRRLR